MGSLGEADVANMNSLVSDITAGWPAFKKAAYSQASEFARTGFIFEISPPDERYDVERGEKARDLAVEEGLPNELGALAGLVCAFESCNQPFDLAQLYLGSKVFYFLQQACPSNDDTTGDYFNDFSVKVAHYAQASSLAQTVVMLDLLAMVCIDQPDRMFMAWWDQPVIAMQAADSRIRDRLLSEMIRE
jgi:hypothetical protein